MLHTFLQIGLEVAQIGSRKYYLRWSAPETARNLDAAVITCDTTLVRADNAGFRCAPVMSSKCMILKLREYSSLGKKPLIMMETSVFSAKYMSMDYMYSVLTYINRLKKGAFHLAAVFTCFGITVLLNLKKIKSFIGNLSTYNSENFSD